MMSKYNQKPTFRGTTDGFDELNVEPDRKALQPLRQSLCAAFALITMVNTKSLLKNKI